MIRKYRKVNLITAELAVSGLISGEIKQSTQCCFTSLLLYHRLQSVIFYSRLLPSFNGRTAADRDRLISNFIRSVVRGPWMNSFVRGPAGGALTLEVRARHTDL
nr:hypothetical protein CFP56_37236 [Quercus suber]